MIKRRKIFEAKKQIQKQYIRGAGSWCSEEDLDLERISEALPCEVTDFPCTYLGLPLSVRKPTKVELLSLIDKIAAHLPTWKASLMNRAGRLVTVKVVLSAVPINAINKLQRAQEQCNANFDEWWSWASFQATGMLQKGLNSIIKLGAWTLWRHCNDCVFNECAPSIATALIMAGEEKCMWDVAGARALSGLPVQGEVAVG